MEDVGIVICGAAIVLAVLAAIGWTFSRSREMLEEWATSNDMRIVSARFCWLRRGPFFWTTSKNQTVYRITVADDDGIARTGWARCGSFWWGVFRKQVEVCWDDT